MTVEGSRLWEKDICRQKKYRGLFQEQTTGIYGW